MTPFEMLHSFNALIITGASSGIGKAFLEHAFKLKPDLYFFNLSRRFPQWENLRTGSARFCHLTCDLGAPETLARSVDTVLEELERRCPQGRVLLVNNSGFGSYEPFPGPSVERNLELVDVTGRAPVELTGRLLPVLQKRGGAIINIASTAAFQATPRMATYGASKAFLLHWSLALREELQDAGIPVLAVCPGPTSTEFFRAAGLQESVAKHTSGHSAEEVAIISLEALSSEQGLVVCGLRNRLLAFFSQMLPKTWSATLARIVIERYRQAREGRSRG